MSTMVIRCESCGTRFNIAAIRIPPGGARVRCSRCHHRFHITPSGQETIDSPPEASEHTASEREDPDLEHPEFLFGASAEPGGGAVAAPPPVAPEPPAPPPARVPGEEELISDDPGRLFELDTELAPPPRNEPAPSTALELGAAGDLLRLDESGHDLFGAPGADLPGAPAGSDAPASRRAFPDPAPLRGAAPAGPLEKPDTLDLAGALGLSHDDGPGTPAPRPAAADPFDWGDDEDPGDWTPLSTGTAPAGSRRPQEQRPAVALVAPERLDDLEFDLDAYRRRGRAAWVASLLIGVALLWGGGANLIRHAIAPVPGPEAVRGAGWIARDVEATWQRDDVGERALAVHGTLRAEAGSGPPAPRVEVTLLDAQGRPLLPVRTSRPAASSGAGATPFTVWIADAPPTARRFRLVLAP